MALVLEVVEFVLLEQLPHFEWRVIQHYLVEVLDSLLDQ
jgi:hypothetical protein